MYKTSIILLILTVFSQKLYSQNYQYKINDFIDVINITANSFDFYNKQNFTIKVKSVNLTTNTVENFWIIPSKEKETLKVPGNYISKSVIDNLKFEVYYDADCLSIDINFINQLKKQKLEDAKTFKYLVNVLSGLAKYKSEVDPNSSWGKRAKSYLNIKDNYERYKSWQEGGILKSEYERYKKEVEDNLREKLIDKSFSDKQVKSIVMGLEEFISSDFEANVDLSEYDLKINELITISSNYMIRGYYLPYDVFFKPHIDFDGDGVPNTKDECPKIGGLNKYYGCTKVVYFNKRKVKYEIAIEGGILPYFNYTYGDNSEPFRNDYKTFSLKNSQYLRLTNYFNVGYQQSMFYIPLQFITAKKYKGEYVEYSSSYTSSYFSNIDFNNYSGGLGYQLKFGTKAFSSDVHFELGLSYTDIKIYQRNSLTTNTNGNQIGFSLNDTKNQLFRTYFAAGMGFDFDYFTINIKYNWIFRLFTSSPTDDSSISTTPSYNGQHLQLGLKFPIYRKYTLK